MTDDIVTRLRLWASVTEGDHVIEELHKAADEIERLRALVEGVRTEKYYWHERCTRAEACADIMHNQINRKWWKR